MDKTVGNFRLALWEMLVVFLVKNVALARQNNVKKYQCFEIKEDVLLDIAQPFLECIKRWRSRAEGLGPVPLLGQRGLFVIVKVEFRA